jgi:hypothetical protein
MQLLADLLASRLASPRTNPCSSAGHPLHLRSVPHCYTRTPPPRGHLPLPRLSDAMLAQHPRSAPQPGDEPARKKQMIDAVDNRTPTSQSASNIARLAHDRTTAPHLLTAPAPARTSVTPPSPAAAACGAEGPGSSSSASSSAASRASGAGGTRTPRGPACSAPSISER